MSHPTADIGFDALVSELSDRMARRLVFQARCPDDRELVLYCYSKGAIYDQAWDPIVEAARGLVLDHRARAVVARPFPKFFNYGERGLGLPDEPFEVLEKVDGSLGIVFHDGQQWRVVTKGSWLAEQAGWARRWLADRGFAGLIPGVTYLFEVVYNDNRIVVRYPFEGLVLLGGYGADGEELGNEVLTEVAEALGTRRCERYGYRSVDEILEAVRTFGGDREGFVVRFASGHRVKIKGAEYLRIHRLMSRVTPLALWEAWVAGDDVMGIRREIPEEFWGDFDGIWAALLARRDEVVAKVDEALASVAHLSDKELGLSLGSVPEPARHFVFAARKGGARWWDEGKARGSVLRLIRPVANELPGYTPSDRVARLEEEAG